MNRDEIKGKFEEYENARYHRNTDTERKEIIDEFTEAFRVFDVYQQFYRDVELLLHNNSILRRDMEDFIELVIGVQDQL